MSIFTSVIVFLLVFWTVLFMVLPWGNKARDISETGMANSAPSNPRIKQKFLITLGISIVIWGIVFTLVSLQVIDFHEISRQMIIDDIQN